MQKVKRVFLKKEQVSANGFKPGLGVSLKEQAWPSALTDPQPDAFFDTVSIKLIFNVEESSWNLTTPW